MRATVVGLTLVAAVAAVTWPVHSQQDDAMSLIALARQALGGEAKLATVTSFTASGRVELLRAARSGGTLELAAHFPDKFALTRQGAAMPTSISSVPSSENLFATPSTFTLGFNGRDVIVSSLASGESLNDVRVRQRYLARAQGEALQVLLGLFAGSMPGLPVRFSAASNSDLGNSVVVSGANMPPTTLSFDSATHLPLRFGNTEYQDYRLVDGLKVPFRLVSGPNRQEITAFHYNVPINPKLFRPSPVGRTQSNPN